MEPNRLYRLLRECQDSTLPWADLQAALRGSWGVVAANAADEGGAEKATLQKCELWREFHGITNEMIVTKAGR